MQFWLGMVVGYTQNYSTGNKGNIGKTTVNRACVPNLLENTRK